MDGDPLRRLIILGAGGHASELLSYVDALPGVTCVGLMDDHLPVGPLGSSRILGDLEAVRRFLEERSDVAHSYITAFGSNSIRRTVAERVEALGLSNLSACILLHPTAVVGTDVEIGEGTCLAPGAVVTARARIGPHCILNTKASVSHDCVVGAFSNINPGATVCGRVTVGEGCFIGAGATVINDIRIGEGAVIGAGAVVITDVPAGATFVGVPARAVPK